MSALCGPDGRLCGGVPEEIAMRSRFLGYRKIGRNRIRLFNLEYQCTLKSAFQFTDRSWPVCGEGQYPQTPVFENGRPTKGRRYFHTKRTKRW